MINSKFPNEIDVTGLLDKSKEDIIFELERINLLLKQYKSSVAILSIENQELKEKLSKFTDELVDTVTQKTKDLSEITKRNMKWVFWHPLKYNKILQHFKNNNHVGYFYDDLYVAVHVDNYNGNKYNFMDLKDFYDKYIKK